MTAIFRDFKQFFIDCKNQDFAFYMAAAYLIFSYLRPQAIYPILDILPWTQLSIVSGLIYLGMNQRLKIQPVHALTFIFFLIILASSYASTYPELSFSKLDVIYIWLIEMFFFTNCIKNLKQFKLLTILFFLILFKMSFFGAKTWALRGFGFTKWGVAGPTGFFANSGEFSLLMAILAVMSLAFILGHKKPRLLYYVLPVSAIMTVMGASSRGGQLALIGGLFILALVIGRIRIKNIFLVTLAGYLAFASIPEEQMARFTDMGEDSTSISRLLYWEKGIEMMNEHPFLGVGYYGFPKYFSDHYSFLKDEDKYLGRRQEVAHNSFIQTGSTLGYTGLACYTAMLILCYLQNRGSRKALKKEEALESNEWCFRYSIGLDAALVTYTIGSFFMSIAFYPYIYLLLMFSQSLLTTTRAQVDKPTATAPTL